MRIILPTHLFSKCNLFKHLAKLATLLPPVALEVSGLASTNETQFNCRFLKSKLIYFDYTKLFLSYCICICFIYSLFSVFVKKLTLKNS